MILPFRLFGLTLQKDWHTRMEKFEVKILGCGSAKPTLRHNPSAQVVNLRDKLSLIDCGEGTQLQMQRYGVKMMAIRNVFLSHLHGDHCLGLVGLISSFGLFGRTKDLHVYAHGALEHLLQEQLALFCHNLDFNVVFHAVDTEAHALIYEDRSVEVWTLPLKHTMPCCGYLFMEKPGQRHILRDMTDAYSIPPTMLGLIRSGQDWTMPDGRVIPNDRLTAPPSPTRSYAYCSDTMYNPALVPLLKGVDLLYHEATYPDEWEAKARARGHSTASQAATIAQKAGVSRLMIGHYSSAVKVESVLLDEARRIFPNTILADEGLVVKV